MIEKLVIFIAILRRKAFEETLISRFLSLVLSSSFVGRVAFKLSIWVKILSVQRGIWSQRAIEYPWVLAQIKRLKSNALILDVGCAESLLSRYEILLSSCRIFKNWLSVGLAVLT
jgi:hypothetical protein